jgi:hypothetical protein
MREIKFRAWDRNENDRFRMKRNLSLNSAYFQQETLSGIEVMQYTGLKDKNGREIYEGDVLQSGNGRLWEVKFGEYKGVFNSAPQLGWYVFGDGNTLMLTKYESASDEIIGNIYENPELLTRPT